MCTMCELVSQKDECAFAPDGVVVTDTAVSYFGELREITEVADALPTPSGLTGTNTQYSMEVGDTFVGDLYVAGDWDWIAIDLTAGQTVQISMDGSGTGGVADTFLSLYGPTGSGDGYLASNDDFGASDFSQITYTAQITDTYYIVADSYNFAYSGDYEISVVTAAAPGPVDAIEQSVGLNDTSINVYFAPSGYTGGGSIGTYTAEGFNAFELAQFEAAFDLIEAVTNVTFNTVTSSTSADFIYILDTNQFSSLGAHEFPDNFGQQFAVYSGANWDRTSGGDLEMGGYGFVTIVHEILHGLGLAHPHDSGGSSLTMNGVTSAYGDYGEDDLNQGIWSTMSYNSGWETEFGSSSPGDNYGVEVGPMALDIAALQNLYGANTSTNTGNTTFTLSDTNALGTYFTAIWDASGTDEIVYGGASNATIDLRAATLEYEEGGGGFVSHVNGIQGGFTIANGVVIENASGGTGNDLIYGNDAANVIRGLRGDDTIYGGGGGDDIKAGIGDDTIYGGGGFDTITGGAGNDVIYGGAGVNKLVGQKDEDTLYGGSERDVLNGGGQNDLLYAYGGNDRVKGGGSDDIAYGGAGPDKMYGNNGNDSLYGGADDDLLNGGGLNDFLDGGDGNDRIKGGDGADDFVFEVGDDRDVIVDFSIVEGDELLIDTGYWATGETAQDLVDDHASVVGGNRVEIDFGGGNTIVLQGVTTTDGLANAIDEWFAP